DGDLPLAGVREGRVEYYLHDHIGSVRCGVGETETRHFTYSPFGVPSEAAAPGDPLRPGFAGMFYDPVAKLYLTKARAYDPELGQFLQLDPIHHTPSPSGASEYAYCRADPVNHTDRD